MKIKRLGKAGRWVKRRNRLVGQLLAKDLLLGRIEALRKANAIMGLKKWLK